MVKDSAAVRSSTRWDSIWFFAAGIFMFVNVVALWVRFYSEFRLSIAWAAVPGIIGLAASVIGLFKLYPHVASRKPLLARCGAGFCLVAGSALCMAAIWVFAASVFGNGISVPPPNGVLALIGIFIVSMVIAFILNAVAFLVDDPSRSLGYLLLAPVGLWGVMLVVGMLNGPEAGLSLDLYTNGFIAAAFLLIASALRKASVGGLA